MIKFVAWSVGRAKQKMMDGWMASFFLCSATKLQILKLHAHLFSSVHDKSQPVSKNDQR